MELNMNRMYIFKVLIAIVILFELVHSQQLSTLSNKNIKVLKTTVGANVTPTTTPVISSTLKTTATPITKNQTTTAHSTTVSTAVNTNVTKIDENGTIFEDNNNTIIVNNTNVNNSSAFVTNNETDILKIPPLPSQFNSQSPGKNICVCDLTVKYCDLNCCCDKDCSFEDKSVFDHCENEFRYRDTRFCDYMEHIYINNTLHEWEVNQNGLFCVMRSNLPPSYTIQRKQPLKTLRDAEIQKLAKFSWPDSIPSDPLNATKSYIYGSPVLIIDKNIVDKFRCDFAQQVPSLPDSQFQTRHDLIGIPQSYITDHCITKGDIVYLVEQKSECKQIEINAENLALNAETYFKNLTVISNPHLFNITWSEAGKIQKECPKNVCLTISPKICKKHFQNCSYISISTYLNVSCHWSISANTYSCNNLVHKIKYNFYHNGSNGISKIDLYLQLTNLTYAASDALEYWQSFEINFIWSNHSLNYSSFLSGNPGYLIGKPILIATLISEQTPLNKTNKNSTYTTTLKFLRNSSDYSTNFMVFHKSINGVCVLDKDNYVPTEFGFNTVAKCEARNSIVKNNKTSAYHMCNEIQRTIFKFWSVDNLANNTLSNKLVGQFGNANANSDGDWIRLMHKNDLRDVLRKLRGQYDTNSIICRGIASMLAIDVYYSRVDFSNIFNQNKILGVTYQFKNFKNLTFPLEGTVVNFSVKITTEIMFFDITTKKVRKLVDAPSFSIKLPYDFFYPFIKISNNGCSGTHYFTLVNLYLFLGYLSCVMLQL